MVFHATADGAIVVDPFLLAFLPGAIPFLAVIQSAAQDLSSVSTSCRALTEERVSGPPCRPKRSHLIKVVPQLPQKLMIPIPHAIISNLISRIQTKLRSNPKNRPRIHIPHRSFPRVPLRRQSHPLPNRLSQRKLPASPVPPRHHLLRKIVPAKSHPRPMLPGFRERPVPVIPHIKRPHRHRKK